MNRENLLACATEGRLMHALLITGQDGEAGLQLARSMASCFLLGRDDQERLLDCPDYICTQPPYKVDGIRDVLSQLSAEAFSADGPARPTTGRRAVIIEQCHKLNTACQNAMLKTLEEPPEGVLFLLAGTEAGMLPTIRSRCATIRIGAGDIATVSATLREEGISPETAMAAAAQSDGVLSGARLYATEAYAAFRQDAIRCFGLYVRHEGSPFAPAQELLKSAAMPPVGEGKLRQETGNAPELLGIWLAIARDALVRKLSPSAPTRQACVPALIREAEKLEADMAARFTTREIQGIISILCEGLGRLGANGTNPVQTLDWVLASLIEKEN